MKELGRFQRGCELKHKPRHLQLNKINTCISTRSEKEYKSSMFMKLCCIQSFRSLTTAKTSLNQQSHCYHALDQDTWPQIIIINWSGISVLTIWIKKGLLNNKSLSQSSEEENRYNFTIFKCTLTAPGLPDSSCQMDI